MAEGFWEIVLNEATTNLVVNPSFEVDTSGYTAGTGSMARAAVQRRGRYGLTVTPTGGGNADVYFALELTINVPYTFSVDFKGTAGVEYQIFFSNTSNSVLGTATVFTATGNWQRVEATWTETSTATRRLHLAKTSANTDDFYTDGWQLEASLYSTTYIDGDQDGGKWLGQPHNSASFRNDQSRDGGLPVLLSDIGIFVNGEPGAGIPPVQHQAPGQGAGDGALFQGMKIMPRTLTLNLVMDGESRTGLHNLRRQVVDLINPRSVFPEQPFIVRYTGNNGIILQSKFVYSTGGEGQVNVLRHTETPPITIVAYDPYWYQDGNKAAALAAVSPATFRLVAGKVNGLWTNFGPPPIVSATYTEIYDIAIDPNDRYVYFAGDFVNFADVPLADYFVVWDRLAQDFDDRFAFNGKVRAVAVDANGDVYVGGEFTSVGAVSANRVAVYSGGSWSALGTGVASGTVHAIAIGTDNRVYFGGAFTTAGGLTVNNLGAWNKSSGAWEQVTDGTSGTNGTVFALSVGPEGFLYLGGAFTTAGSGAAVRIAGYTASLPDKVFFPLGGGVNGDVAAVLARANGDVFVGGAFTTADGNSISGIARWNGQTFLPLGLGVNSLPQVLDMAFTADGLLWVVGTFSVAGEIQNIGRIAIWNGSRWQQIDADLPYTSGPNAIEAINNDVYFGLDNSGAGQYGSVVTVNNSGSAWAYPVLYIKRVGGDSVEVRTIVNETTGAKLLLSYNLLDGEELIIDLRPLRRMMYSSLFGTRWKLQPDSDVEEFFLVKGDNNISIYTLEVSSPAVTAHIVWLDTFISSD